MPVPLSVSPGQFAALQAACDALIPSLDSPDGNASTYWSTKASDLNVAEALLEVMGDQPRAAQKEFLQLLSLMENGFAMGFIGGGFRKFRTLSPEKQVASLQKWSQSRLGLLRKAFSTLKKLTAFIHYGSSPDGPNPSWTGMDYPGPLDETPGEKPRIEPLRVDRAIELTCDVVVVGSGSGGGLVAGMLAEAGQDVIVVEKGPYMAGSDFTNQEAEMISATYDRMGALTTEDVGTNIFAGSCLGGGTTINWTGSFPTPDHVLEDWSRDHGLDFVRTPYYRDVFDQVMTSFSVNADHSPDNPQNDALRKGSEKLGQQVEFIQRNVGGCDVDGGKHCGYCGLGCRQGHKRSMMRTWLQRAVDADARILVDTEVQRVVVSSGQARGIEALATDANGKTHPVTIRAERVVVAAGSIQTPALLMRSGLQHPQLGKNLYFHPTVAVPADYGQPMRPWFGVMMSTVNKVGMKTDGHFGYWIETPPVHAGLAALALPWKDPVQHKSDLARMVNMANFIVLVRDKHGGHVTVDREGKAIVHYQLHPYDRQHLLAGIADAMRIHAAAGAKEIMVPHNSRTLYRPLTTKITLEDFISQMSRMNWGTNHFNLFTAHQMGTCGMGTDAQRHPCTPEGQFRGVKGLYVADGSVLPTAAGVNPMISIMALAYHIGQGMVG